MLAIFALAAVIPAFVAAQSIPSCALTCTLQLAGASACGGVTNVNCLCTNTDFQRNVFQCYVNTCTGADLQAAAAYGAQTCAAVGVTLDPTAIPAGVTGVSTPAGAASSASSSAAAASSSGSSSAAAASGSSAPTASAASTSAPASSSAAPSSSAAGGTGAAAGAFERGNVLVGAVAAFAGAAGLFAML